MSISGSCKFLPAVCRFTGGRHLTKSSARTISDYSRTGHSYYTAKDIEFCPGRAKDVMQNNVIQSSQTVQNEDPFAQGKKYHHEDPASDEGHAEIYKADCSVSLYSVMQSNVPEPFSSRSKAPTHLNMPGGGFSRDYKYVSEKFQNVHQWNH